MDCMRLQVGRFGLAKPMAFGLLLMGWAAGEREREREREGRREKRWWDVYVHEENGGGRKTRC